MYFLSALLLIAILIFIHEFGHFIVAKMCGVHCSILSIGFGKRIWGFQYGGTDYRISSFPFGGYVRMSGADPFGDGNEDDHWLEDQNAAFMRKPVWKRLLIVAAGPAFNLLLPIVTITALLMAGEPQPAPVVGLVDWDSPAAQAGIEPQDTIRSINDTPINSWGNLVRAFSELEAGTHSVVVERTSQSENPQNTVTLNLDVGEDKKVGIDLLRPSLEIGIDDPNSPAAKAGLQMWDHIVSVDGQDVQDLFQIHELISQAEKADKMQVAIGYERGEATKRSKGSVQLLLKSGYESKEPLSMPGINPHLGILPATVFVKSVSSKKMMQGGGCQPPITIEEETPAAKQGVKSGDRFLRLNNKPTHSWGDVIALVKSSMQGEGEKATATTMKVELFREGKVVSLDITPKVIRDTDSQGRYRYRPVLGAIRGGDYTIGPQTRIYYSFGDAITKATEQTVFISGLIIEQIGKLIMGEAAVEKSVGGPVEMVRQASKAAEAGLFEWVRLMSMLSISLGIVNLVPFPVLDGGQILFYLAEAVRGRPLSIRFREATQQIGVVILVLFMLMVLIIDISRLFES
jgi:regulator of sigma E protease